MADTDMNFTSRPDRQSMFTLREPVKLVIWDLDDTFWRGTLSEGDVDLIGDNVAVVRNLNRRGIVNAICSNNDFTAAKQRLETAGLWDDFVFPRIGWMPKGQAIARLIDEMQLRAPNVLFIDDKVGSLREAEFFAVGLQTAGPEIIPELLDLPQVKGKDDSKLSRLMQYRQLQGKLDDRQSWTASNEDFLRSCDIHVEISTDLAAERDRVLELINRSNQLNYTKRRLTDDEFTHLIKELGRDSGYIRVLDRYGDYGICGFYSSKGGELTDFVFSCRILNMGVEGWLYQHLGSPRISVVGEVATALEPETPVDWISAASAEAATASVEPAVGVDIRGKVLLKGGCDLILVDDFLAGKFDTELSYTNGNGCYVDWHHIEVMRRSNSETLTRFGKVIDRLPFISRAEYNTRVLDPARGYTHIALSLLNEYGQALYRLRNTEFVVPYGQYYMDITDPHNWSELGAKGLRPAFLKWFSEEFEFRGALTVKRFGENIRWLSQAIPDGCTLVLINGAEADPGDPKAAVTRLHLHHERYNQALDELAAELPNVRICDVREFIRTPDDVTFNTRHYSRRAYLALAESLAVQTQSSVRVVERNLFSSAMHKVLRLLRAPGLPARGVRALRTLPKLPSRSSLTEVARRPMPLT
jgi:FkbH-like protein